MKANVFEQMAEKWPSAIVSREQIGTFTGGIMSPGRLANLDCSGLGPERIRIGRKVGYPVVSLVKWLSDRATTIEKKGELSNDRT